MKVVSSGVSREPYKPDLLVGGGALLFRLYLALVSSPYNVNFTLDLLPIQRQAHLNDPRVSLGWMVVRWIALAGLMAGRRWAFWTIALLFGYDSFATLIFLRFWGPLSVDLPADAHFEVLVRIFLGGVITLVVFVYAILRLKRVLPRKPL